MKKSQKWIIVVLVVAVLVVIGIWYANGSRPKQSPDPPQCGCPELKIYDGAATQEVSKKCDLACGKCIRTVCTESTKQAGYVLGGILRDNNDAGWRANQGEIYFTGGFFGNKYACWKLEGDCS